MVPQNSPREPLGRDKIVDHTLTLIEEHGIAGFRLKDLASRLQVTIPNLYRHFKNRDDIVYSALTDDYIAMCSATTQRIDEMTTRVTATSDLVSALRHDDASSPTPAHRRRTTRLHALAAFEGHERSEEIRAALHKQHVAMENFFRRAQEVGLVDSHYSPVVLTLVASSMLTGVAVTEVDPYLQSAEDDLWGLIHTFLESLRPNGRSVE